MGVKESIKGLPKEKGWQMLIRGDTFFFRNIPVENGSLIEKDGNGQPLAAFELNSVLVKEFKGDKQTPIRDCALTISYARDIRFDPLNETSDVADKDKGSGKLNKAFVTERAEAKMYQHTKKPPANILFNRAVLFLGGVALMLALALGIKAAGIGG